MTSSRSLARRLPHIALCVTGLLPFTGCTPRPAGAPDPSRTAPIGTSSGTASAPAGPAPFKLVDVTARRGIDFRHECGARVPLTIVETMGGGAAFFDYDGDGWPDVFLVSSGQDFQKTIQKSGSRLYHNRGDGSFEDVTAKSGIVIDHYAMGCCVGDYDNDGHTDLCVTGYGKNWLYRNLGDGTFKDVTSEAGLLQRPRAWGIGCAFLDVNRDGLLDLYIGNYIRYDPKIPFCLTSNVEHGCTPNQYTTQPNELYMNLGGGRFAEKAVALGAEDTTGASLGVLICDFDDDGWMDIFIANDGTPNALLHNLHGKFRNVGQESGVAFGEDGIMRAGMGTDAADIDGDGRFDLVITNFQNEPNSIYRNMGKVAFREVSYPSGVGTPSLNHLKFGVSFVDIDGDGKPDLYQGNGHVYDNVAKFSDMETFEQIDQIYHNIGGGRYKEVSPATGAFPGTPSVTRAVTIGDFNNDGRADILTNNLGRPARLLENQSARQGAWLGLKLIGTRSNRDAIGSRIELKTPDGLQVREVRSGGSYTGQADLRVLFNMARAYDAKRLSLKIRWPSGRVQSMPVPALNAYSTVKESQ